MAIQVVAVAATAVSTATLAASRGERQIVDRLNGVIEAVGQANFPYSGSVLSKMRGLSGAHFVAYSQQGRVTSTSLPAQTEVPPFRNERGTSRLKSMGESPRVILGGTSYLALTLASGSRPEGETLLVLYPETTWRQARRDAALPPILLGLGSLAVMAMATSWIAYRINARLRRMESQVALIAGGDFQELDPGDEGDEVSALAASINRMSVQLKEMSRTIRRSERTRLVGQLAAGLAHQLRNSLTGARMSVQLHARRHPVPEGDECLKTALLQLEMTEEQVKGLLSLGRVERREPTLCDIQQLLQDIALLVHPSCQHSKVTLRVKSDDESIPLLVDFSSVRAAVLNLTLNAIEAAGHGGEVRLDVLEDEDEIRIDVVDDGPGPPDSIAGELSEAFATSKPEGVGLGLALAKQVAEDHGGRLSWKRVGQETKFTLIFPKALVTTEGVR